LSRLRSSRSSTSAEYVEDSYAFFDRRLKTKTPEHIEAARAALVEIIASVDEQRANEGFKEILAANKNTDERLIRGLIGIMLDVLATKEADGNATYIDTLVWMISNEKYDRYKAPAAAVAAAVRIPSHPKHFDHQSASSLKRSESTTAPCIGIG
jgi:hypothetical protein